MASIQLDQFLQQSVCIQRSPCCGKDREKGLDEEESEKCGVEKQIDERFTHFQMTTFFPSLLAHEPPGPFLGYLLRKLSLLKKF